MEQQKIDIFKCLDFLRDNSERYAIAKANVTYMTEYRKTIKSEIMNQSMAKTEAAKESEAYASERYKEHLELLRQAIVEFEHIRWLMLGAEVKAEVWRSLESSNRILDRSAR
jgi:hypothetical protein